MDGKERRSAQGRPDTPGISARDAEPDLDGRLGSPSQSHSRLTREARSERRWKGPERVP